MIYQQGLFAEYLDPIVLKEGKKKCPCCARPMKSYGYNLDKKLVAIAFDIINHCTAKKTMNFSSEGIFGQDFYSRTQFQKLQYFGIIKREKGWWKLTRGGYNFLRGDKMLPRKVWVFAGKTVMEDDDY